MYVLSRVVGVKGVKFEKGSCAHERPFRNEFAVVTYSFSVKLRVSFMSPLCKCKSILVAVILTACELFATARNI
jgi:hypothetical protein